MTRLPFPFLFSLRLSSARAAFALVTFALAALPACKTAPVVPHPDADYVAKLRAYTAAGAGDRARCAAYAGKMKPLAKLVDRGGEKVFATGAVAREVMRQLAKNPGAPESVRDARFYILDQPDRNQESFETADELRKMKGFCEGLSTFEHLRRLLDGFDRYRFSRAERDQAIDIALQFVNIESSYPAGLVPLMLETALLGKLADVDPNLARWTPEIQDSATRMSALKNEIRDDYGRVAERKDSELVQSYADGLTKSEPERKRVRAIFNAMVLERARNLPRPAPKKKTPER